MLRNGLLGNSSVFWGSDGLFCVELKKKKKRFRHVKTWYVLLVVVGVECVGDLQLLLVLAPHHHPTFKVGTLQLLYCYSVSRVEFFFFF